MSTPSPLVYLHTLGCPKNEADTNVLARRLRRAGLTLTSSPDDATHMVINTCGFIEEAKEESISAVLEATAAFPVTPVLVMGCLVERYRQELERGIPEVRGWFGLNETDKLVEALADAQKASTIADSLRPATGRRVSSPSGPHPGLPRQTLVSRPAVSYGYVKISDGCDHRCSFCAIPGIKGPHVALSIKEIMEQADDYLARGAAELVLVGQDTGLWHGEGLDLLGLVELMAKDSRVKRLRLMYLQPEHVDERLLEFLSSHPKLCRYLDMPLQHVSGPLLRRMGRPGDADTFRRLLAWARLRVPDVSIRSTFIVGFPGETEAQFAELLTFVEEAHFDHAGAYLFSPEEGTRAAAFRPRVPRRTGRSRLASLTAALLESGEAAARGRIGSSVEVLIDAIATGGLEGAVAVGRTVSQAPEVDGVTYLLGEASGDTTTRLTPGAIVPAVVRGAVGHDLLAEWDGA